jgi:hypothetical protein
MTESRQVRRAKERRQKKRRRLKYPMQKGGPSIMKIHRNRKHRGDGQDYFETATVTF